MRLAIYARVSLIILGVIAASVWLAVLTHDRFGLKEAIQTRQAGLLVDDGAALLTPEQQDAVAQYHAALLDAYDIDFRVATVQGDIDINMSAATRFADLRIGGLSAAGRGLLLLIAPDIDQVRIEVGRGLEPVFTDAFVAYIETRQMVPFFKANRVANGILATTGLIAGRAKDGVRTEAFADPKDGMAEPSTGAGARTQSRIGAGYERPEEGMREVQPAGLGPKEVVSAYLDAMAAGNANPELEIFTAESRSLMRDRVITPAQMSHVSRTYRNCRPPGVRQTEARALVRYGKDERACAPFFLRLRDSEWRLDLTLMTTAIRFNHRNEWRFPNGPPPEFAFGFQDWRFDKHGFPH